MAVGSSRGSEWEAVRKRVLERDGYVCVVCQAPATHVDHIIPKARGGTDEMSNLQAMCATHNLKKGTKVVVRGVYWDENILKGGLPSRNTKN